MNSDEVRRTVTDVTLDTQEIKFLIDCMWGQSRHDSQALAIRHKINDVSLEARLQKALGDALYELDQ